MRRPLGEARALFRREQPADLPMRPDGRFLPVSDARPPCRVKTATYGPVAYNPRRYGRVATHAIQAVMDCCDSRRDDTGAIRRRTGVMARRVQPSTLKAGRLWVLQRYPSLKATAQGEGVSAHAVSKGARIWRDHPTLLQDARDGRESKALQNLMFLVNEGEELEIESLSLQAAKETLRELVVSHRAGARVALP